jgi:glycosyltransferase involved in cell wall biosynthesis
MKKVFIISYYFPPAGGVSGQRALKFAKYLMDYGWQPVVLTAREKDYVLLDESLLSDVPEEVRVFRTPAPDLYQWYGKIGARRGKSPADLSALSDREGHNGSWLNQAALFIRSLLFIPDARVGWLPFALCEGLKQIKKERPDLIFTTSPPFTTALIGGLLSAVTGLPWISDYRDPWTQAYFYFKRPAISRKLEEFIEKKLLMTASRVISINHRILEGLDEKYDVLEPEKRIIITNGYDPEDFEGVEPLVDNDFTVTYTGTINVRMSPAPFLDAVVQLCQEHPEFAKKVRLNFIGRVGPDVADLFRDLQIKARVHLKSHLSHRECLRYMLGAEMLLLIIPYFPGNELHMSGKLFEYIRSGKPILCLSDRGDAVDVINRTGTGFCVGYQDIRKIKEIVWRVFQRWMRGKDLLKDPIDWKEVKVYDRRRGAEQLARLMDEIVVKNKLS